MANQNQNLSSNLNQGVKKSLSISENFCQLWVSSAYHEIQKLQYLVFPEGMSYDKENKVVLTNKINSIFSEIALQQSALEVNKNGNLLEDYHFGICVGMTRFELATPRPPDVCATGLRYIPKNKGLQI